MRGLENDYVIDYSTGEITFNSRIDIRSRSRAQVDYTYTGSDYAANNELLGVSAGPFGVFFYRKPTPEPISFTPGAILSKRYWIR